MHQQQHVQLHLPRAPGLPHYVITGKLAMRNNVRDFAVSASATDLQKIPPCLHKKHLLFFQTRSRQVAHELTIGQLQDCRSANV
jgi:hypothetical protein